MNAAWAMVTVWSATNTAPCRAPPVFAPTDRFTVPPPSPCALPSTATHVSRERAVQLQPVIAVTAICRRPPAALTSAPAGSSRNVHGAPSCETSTVTDSTVNPARRALGDGFEVTLNGSVVSP